MPWDPPVTTMTLPSSLISPPGLRAGPAEPTGRGRRRSGLEERQLPLARRPGGRLELQEGPLAVEAAGVAGERAVLADDPVARADDRQRVRPDGSAHRARERRVAEPARELPVGRRLAVGDDVEH